MYTPKDLMKDTWKRWKYLAMLNGRVEDYILYSFAKITSFAIGLSLGYYIWGA